MLTPKTDEIDCQRLDSEMEDDRFEELVYPKHLNCDKAKLQHSNFDIPSSIVYGIQTTRWTA